MVRWSAASILLLLTAPVVGAVPLLDDPAGDIDYGGLAALPPGTPWQPADLLSLDLEETPTLFRFLLRVAPPAEPDARGLQDAIEWVLRFNVGAYAYRIEAYEQPIFGSSDWLSASLYQMVRPGDAFGDRVAALDGWWQPTAGALTVEVPRADLRDELGAETVAEDILRGAYVESFRSFLLLSSGGDPLTPEPHDRMPDRGDESYEVRLGAKQVGHVRMATEERLRASNGVATTYFFDINVSNLETYDDEFHLSLAGVPASWQVRLPFDSIAVPGNNSVRFPLLATVPFSHQHGVIETFLVEAASKADVATVGRLELGVEYLATAQPAGHHSVSFLHGGGNGETIGAGLYGARLQGINTWFNTVPEDPRSGPHAVATPDAEGATTRFGWVFPLDPSLRLGLDFDLDDMGALQGSLVSDLDLAGSWVEGNLLLVGKNNITSYPDDYDDLAGARLLGRILPTDVAGNSFEAPLEPDAFADLIPPRRNDNMVLVLWVHTQVPPAYLGESTQVALEAGASLRLPLNEYHDPIDEAFAAPEFIHIDTRGAVERFVAPGGTILYELLLRNDGVNDGTFQVSAYGSNADWVQFPAGRTFVAPSVGEAVIPIAIRPPPDALEGDEADIVVEAVAREDERMRGLMRLSAVVDSSRAEQDDIDDTQEVLAIEEAQEKASPGLPILLLLVAIGLAARRAARR